ncbi:MULTISPECIES: transglycosylase SLT domain-containing protein [Streptococcus]|uniref:Transglycosylase SLT domain-containing protein n=1 Tax=Streptococcus caledonicus TaxID=2614158 RepID=A0ABW0UCD1_9STRE|nr:transglycosylase SLT domain-containing protein [Streptococcus sp. S784/96/1]
MSNSRVTRRSLKKQKSKQIVLGLLFTSLSIVLTTQSVNTESYVTSTKKENTVENFEISSLETSVPLTIKATTAVSTEANAIAFETTNLLKSVHYEELASTVSVPTENLVNEIIPQVNQTANHYNSQLTATSSVSYSGVLANGNTAGVIGTEAAAQMAKATGVPQSTWEYIIARESNGNPNVANASGASGLFQTMPGWGSTATVQDQINSALNAYNSQGLAAWGMQ